MDALELTVITNKKRKVSNGPADDIVNPHKCRKTEEMEIRAVCDVDDLLLGVDFDDDFGESTKTTSTAEEAHNKTEDIDNLLCGIDFTDEAFHDNVSGCTVSAPRLDLSNWTRCIIESISKDKTTFDLVIQVKEDSGTSTTTCRLQGPWSASKVTENEIVSILAKWSDKHQCFCVSSESGFFIVSPDYLVSGTSVVGSLFCRRKGVLAERFTGVDCNSKIMAIGSMVHELFQTVIKRELTNIVKVKAVVEEMISSPEFMFMLYEIEMSIQDIRLELEKFIPKIVTFVNQYITGDDVPIDKNVFMDKIDNIIDIEENIWVPSLGLKGKVDVSVKVRRRNHFADADVELMPLELKTGRASFSSEHKGQLIIYQMMMSETGYKVNSGLLLYLREGIMKEIKVTRNDQRDLILLRNEAAYFMSRNTQQIEYRDSFNIFSEKIKTFGIPELPEPINHHSACGNCPYINICCAFLKRDTTHTLSESNPLKYIVEGISKLLADSHIDYFIHWTGLLSLEQQQCGNENELKSLWTESPETRQKRRMAIIDLVICEKVQTDYNNYLHTFTPQFRQQKQSSQNNKSGIEDLTNCGINVGDYLRVSTAKRVNIAAGRVTDIKETTISISLERNLSIRYRNQVFILDKNDSQVSIRFNLANLGAMLNDGEITNQLRKIIIDRMPPTFTKTLPKIIAIDGKPILKELNKIQQAAILKALTANEYLLLKGLPGTGKTQTLVAIIRLLVLMGKSVIITSHTHSAVDNVLHRLLKFKLNFLRLGDPARVALPIRPFCEMNVIKNCKTPEDLDKLYRSYLIVGVTCLGASHAMLVHRKFDVCLVDEATQVLQCTVIRPLLAARKFILVGDPEQLPPIVRSKEAKNLGAEESLFKRLDCEAATAVLTLQYRMNRVITKLANSITYNGALLCATDAVASATLKMPQSSIIGEQFPGDKWLHKTLSTHIDNSIILLNTKNVFTKSIEYAEMQKMQAPFVFDMVDKTDVTILSDPMQENVEQKITRIYTNYCEAGLVVYIVNALLLAGVPALAIGIVAPYTAQVELMKKCMVKLETQRQLPENHSIEVNTVDQYQGRDKEVIIYTCTKCDNPMISNEPNTKRDGEILEDCRRLTVAITRSKRKLIIIGDVASLENYTPFNKLFSSLSGMAKLNLNDGEKGFNWNTILNNLNQISQKQLVVGN